MFTDHLTPDELERLYYSAGLSEIARWVARAADADAEVAAALRDTVPKEDYDTTKRTAAALEDLRETAQGALLALHTELSDESKRLNRDYILGVLSGLALALQVPNER